MKLSTKGRYAMVALADLAMLPEGSERAVGDVEAAEHLAALSGAAFREAAPRRAGDLGARARAAATAWRGRPPRSGWSKSSRRSMRR
jgi:hypothetical protein